MDQVYALFGNWDRFTNLIMVEYTGPRDLCPSRATDGAAGFDLRSAETVVVPPIDQIVIDTGLCLSIPFGFEGQIRPRSGLAKAGLTIPNSPGTIDSDYRGPVKVILRNNTSVPYQINKGDRIAQLVLHRLPEVYFVQMDTLDSTDRGHGGFGSTGIN